MDYRDDAYAQYLAEMALRKRQQDLQNAAPPVGIGPVSDAELYGAMLNRGPDIPWNESQQVNRGGAIPRDNGQPMQTELQDTPIDELVGRMVPRVGEGGEVVPAGINRGVAQFSGKSGLDWLTPEERAMVVAKREKPMTLKDTGIGTNEPSGSEKPAIVDDIKKEVGPAAGEVQQQPSKEQVAAVTELAKEKIVSDPNATPQEKQDKMNQLDSNPGIAQKLAMIAMAVAPTMVGYAMAGKKGAFLGAAATGRGLEAGAKQYQEEDEFKKKLALEREKMSIEKKSKADTVLGVDQYGRQIIIDKQSGQTIPVTINGEGQAMVAETEVFNPATQMWERKKFKDLPGTQVGSGMPVVSLVDELGKIASTKNEKGKPLLPRGYLNDPELKDIVIRYPNIRIGDPAPDGVSKKTWDRLQTQLLADKERLKKAADKIQTAEATEQVKPPATDKAGDARYAVAIKDNIIDPQFKKLMELRNRSAIHTDKLSTSLKGVLDGKVWYNYLAEIQGDGSVIRPGESETAMAFMPLKQKLDGFINRYGSLQSWMTDELRADVIKMFTAQEEIIKRNMVLAFNDETKEAARIGKTHVLEQRMPTQVKTMAKEWARRKLAGPIRQINSPKEADEMLSLGKFNNGDMFMYNGKPFIVRGIIYGDEKSGFKRLNKGIIEPWRLGR